MKHAKTNIQTTNEHNSQTRFIWLLSHRTVEPTKSMNFLTSR